MIISMPGLEKLTSMEAQRVINVLEDVLERLDILAHVTAGNPNPDLLDALVQDGLPTVASALGEQWRLEEAYLVERAKNASAAMGRFHRRNKQDPEAEPPPVNPELCAALRQAVRRKGFGVK